MDAKPSKCHFSNRKPVCKTHPLFTVQATQEVVRAAAQPIVHRLFVSMTPSWHDANVLSIWKIDLYIYQGIYISMYKCIFWANGIFFLFPPRVFSRALGSVASREPAGTPGRK